MKIFGKRRVSGKEARSFLENMTPEQSAKVAANVKENNALLGRLQQNQPVGKRLGVERELAKHGR